ncbi:MAG TPA: HNH endonuclease [Kofleriaceae bacterium]
MKTGVEMKTANTSNDAQPAYRLHASRKHGVLRASEPRSTEPSKPPRSTPWQQVHDELVRITKRRAELDADELRWLVEAERLQIWKPFGMVSMIDYMERVLGYAPRTAQHRIQAGRALSTLPETSAALRRGELCFSAVKELARVATRGTEQAWIDAVRGKNLRQVEELTSGRRRGDSPDTPANPEARLHVVRLEDITGSTFALFRQAQQRLTEQRGSHVSDDDVLAAMATAVLSMIANDSSPTEEVPVDDAPIGEMPVDGTPSPGARTTATQSERAGRRSKSSLVSYLIALSVCPKCNHAEQQGGGASIPIDEAALERALCNAQHIGSVDGKTPARATRDIPPAIQRLVWARDKGVCQTPGCRSCIGLEIHHIIPRSQGGTNDPSNLTLRCSSCHQAHHEGRLRISGRAPDNVVTESVIPRGELAGRRDFHDASLRADAISAMRQLGWKPQIATHSVDTALAKMGPNAPLDEILRAALQAVPNKGSA